MKRVALTIILNGLHHLKHNEYYKTMLDMFDHWVIVEGASGNNGSTSWCNDLGDSFHDNGCSIDGTTEFLCEQLASHEKVSYIMPSEEWKSKDEQVNAGIEAIKELVDECFLWEVDIDEQWNIEDIQLAEKILVENNAKTGCFLCDYYVGPGLRVQGDWGEGRRLPYRRLWNWSGEDFETHEPPRLKGGNGLGILIPVRFKHYAYYFEQDVLFKDKWYGGHEGIHRRWEEVQKITEIKTHISKLLGTESHWGQGNTYIIKESNE
jgi:hypothetical protein